MRDNKMNFCDEWITNFFKFSLFLAIIGLMFIRFAYSQAVPMRANDVKSSVNISEFESVNLFDGKFSFRLPLASVGGRGSGNGLSLHINPRWRQDTIITGSSNGGPTYGELTILDPYSLMTVKPNMGGYVIGRTEVLETVTDSFCWGQEPDRGRVVGFTITFNSFSGGSYTFRSVSGNGQPTTFNYNNGCYPPPAFIGTEFVSWEDSRVKFISDTTIQITNEATGFPSVMTGLIKMPDGTTYRVENGLVIWVTDRNGNKTLSNFTCTTCNSEYIPSDETVYVTSVKDSLNREITLVNGINYKGVGGSPRTVRYFTELLPNALAPGQILQTRQQLFPWSQCYSNVTPAPCTETNQIGVVNRVELPNGQNYRLYYNSYSEIARVELPTGGAIEYDYEFAASQSFDRRLKERRVYSNGTTLENKTQYIYSYYLNWNDPLPAETNTIVKVFDGAGNQLSVSKHYFGGCVLTNGQPCLQPSSPGYSNFSNSLTQVTTGKEIKTEIYAGNGTTLLRKTEIQYEPRTNVTWTTSNISIPIDARVKEVTNTLADSGQISKVTYGYDSTVSYNLQTDTFEYDYGAGQFGNFLRRTHTDYKKDSPYTNSLVNLLNLPMETWVSSDINGNNKVSRTQYEYDNYASDTNHAPLLNRSNITGHSSSYGTSFITRGNLTKATSYADATNQTGAVSVYTQYDIAGNVVKAIDAKGNAGTIDYTDKFGTSDGEARNQSAPSILGGQQTFAFATSATNVVGYTTYAQFDYYTGVGVDAEDINGNVSTIFYNDLLDRPTQTISANNRPQFRRQTTAVYDDTNRKVTVTSDSKVFGDNLIKSEAFYDGLGRTTESRQYENGSNYIAAFQQYDSLGRAYKSSNPYRPYLNEQANWTETKFDDLGRVTEVKTPDNAKVTRIYNGNSVRVYDQALRSRAGITDALGRMTKVIEYDAGANLETNYTYDVLGRLRKTSQIDQNQVQQNRYFMYNDLGRLIRAKQTEQTANSNLTITDSITGNSSWSVAYNYDANGNVISTTDSRNITITGTYDNLNRLTLRDYSNSTPDVSFTFDNPNSANSKGQLTTVSSSVSATNYTAFDELGRIKSNQQVTNGQTYNFADYSYDLSGALVQQTYPSGRIVKTQTDDIGRLSKVTSQVPNQFERTYLSNLSYTSFGGVERAKLGNGRWESAQFDAKRLQTRQIGLGASSGDTSLLKIEYDFGTTDNNGTLRQQKITVPGASNLIIQNYSYDSLNRLQSATETVNAQVTWKQTFLFDRFGNRRFDANNTTTLPANNGVYNPQIDANTNKFLVAEGYNYDNEGNLTSNPENQLFTYDAENRQTQVQNTASQTSANYFYDGNGKRVRKIVGQEETIFVYDAFSKLVAEYSNIIDNRPKATSYLTTDDLGSPRIITNQTGQVISRHDYHPFGEEVMANVGGRTTAQGYAGNDGVRNQFTSYERDVESGLDYAQARYFSSKHGRFTSVDPLPASANIKNPQTFNRYNYALNSPYKFTDPLGLYPSCTTADCSGFESDYETSMSEAEREYNQRLQNTNNAAAANRAIANGDQATAERICASNLNLTCNRSEPSVTVTATVNTVSSSDTTITQNNPVAGNAQPIFQNTDSIFQEWILYIASKLGRGATFCSVNDTGKCGIIKAASRGILYELETVGANIILALKDRQLTGTGVNDFIDSYAKDFANRFSPRPFVGRFNGENINRKLYWDSAYLERVATEALKEAQYFGTPLNDIASRR